MRLCSQGGTFIFGGRGGLAQKFASENFVGAPNFASKNKSDKYPKCTFRILGGWRDSYGKMGNFGRVGDKSMFKMYKKAGIGREGDI